MNAKNVKFSTEVSVNTKSYWCVLPQSDLNRIKENGIPADTNGNIYLMEHLHYTDPIWYSTLFMPDRAANMHLGLLHYVLIEISAAGIENKLSKGDDISNHHILKQESIAPQFILNVEKRKADEIKMAIFHMCCCIGYTAGMHSEEFLKCNKDALPFDICPEMDDEIVSYSRYFESTRKSITMRKYLEKKKAKIAA